jgi:hypothetical protein
MHSTPMFVFLSFLEPILLSTVRDFVRPGARGDVVTLSPHTEANNVKDPSHRLDSYLSTTYTNNSLYVQSETPVII